MMGMKRKAQRRKGLAQDDKGIVFPKDSITLLLNALCVGAEVQQNKNTSSQRHSQAETDIREKRGEERRGEEEKGGEGREKRR